MWSCSVGHAVLTPVCARAIRCPPLNLFRRSRRCSVGAGFGRRKFCAEADSQARILALANNIVSVGEEAAQSHPKVYPVIDAMRTLTRMEAERADIEEQQNSETDAELKQLYDDELSAADERLQLATANLEEVLLLMLRWADNGGLEAASATNAVSSDANINDNDSRDVVLEISPGVGGTEAGIFAGELLEMYERFADGQGWEFDVEHFTELVGGGLQSATVRITGPDTEDRAPHGWLRYESGVHRVQRVPTTDRKGRMQTSSAVVVVIPMAIESDLELAPSDIHMEVSKKSSGPGGQSVNAAHQAIRATHLPTGVSVFSASSQSQHENRQRAVEMLRTRLLAQRAAARNEVVKGTRKAQSGTGDRSEKIRTYNFQRDEVIDHMLGKGGTGGKVMAANVLYGTSIEDLLSAHRSKTRAERLRQAISILEAAEFLAAKDSARSSSIE